MRPSPRRPYYALHPSRLSVPCPPSTPKRKTVQRSNLEENLSTSGVTDRAVLRLKGQTLRSVTERKKRCPNVASATDKDLEHRDRDKIYTLWLDSVYFFSNYVDHQDMQTENTTDCTREVYILSLVERLSLCWRQTLSSWAIMEPAMPRRLCISG